MPSKRDLDIDGSYWRWTWGWDSISSLISSPRSRRWTDVLQSAARRRSRVSNGRRRSWSRSAAMSWSTDRTPSDRALRANGSHHRRLGHAGRLAPGGR